MFTKPKDAIRFAKEKLHQNGVEVFSGKWQSIDVEQPMVELLNHTIKFVIPDNIVQVIDEVRPNLPWAKDHLAERVGGEPLNPPPSNEWWPFAQRGNSQFKADTKFSHTYPERLWTPKLKGIRYDYGNMGDVVDMLRKEPFTRQAFLPMWFPEDTGATHGERVPCTIGYHFIRRDDVMHLTYYIRSCDYLRHLRDDIYLACGKLFWILDQLKNEPGWENVKPGYFNMHIVSLHVFKNELGVLRQKNK